VIKRIATCSKFLERREKPDFLLRLQKYYHIDQNLRGCNQSCIPACTNGWKMYLVKESSALYEVKKEYNVNVSTFYTQKTIFNIMYVRSIEHRAVRLLTLWIRITNFWNWNERPSYVEIALGDHHGHGIIVVSRNMEGSLWAVMEYLQNASKQIQRQFHKRWTAANGQSLHAGRCYARTSQFFVRTHDDDRNDTTSYV